MMGERIKEWKKTINLPSLFAFSFSHLHVLCKYFWTTLDDQVDVAQSYVLHLRLWWQQCHYEVREKRMREREIENAMSAKWGTEIFVHTIWITSGFRALHSQTSHQEVGPACAAAAPCSLHPPDAQQGAWEPWWSSAPRPHSHAVGEGIHAHIRSATLVDPWDCTAQASPEWTPNRWEKW